jgi:hypothetical protein
MIVGLYVDHAQAAKVENHHDSFNGYTLGAPISSYPALKLVKKWSAEEVKEVGEYENPGEALTVNGVFFLKIRYRFADGLLESIRLVYHGRENRERLVKWLETQYGKLTSFERRMINQLELRGEKMSITLSYSFSHQEGTLWFISTELNHRLSDSIASLPD